MPDLPHEELLSAYLDGEVSPEERARAERLLAENPDARRLFRQMQALQGSLGGLPQQALPDDFSQRVLRQAERQVLGSGGPSAETDAEAIGSPENDARPVVNAESDDDDAPPFSERVRRPLVCILLAIAAVILAAIYNPLLFRLAGGSRPVAVGDSVATEGISNYRMPRRGAATSKQGPSDTSAPGLPPPQPPSEAATSTFESDAEGLPSGGMAGAKFGKNAGQAGGFGGAGVERLAVPDPDAAGLGATAIGAQGGLLIVKLDVADAAAQSGAFRKLLTTQQLDWQRIDSAGERQAGEGQPGEGKPGEKGDPTEQGGEDRFRDFGNGKPQYGGQPASDVDLYYVEATPEQIEATLTELRSRTDAYLSVEMAPAQDAPLQAHWQMQYSRNRGLSNDFLQQQVQPLAESAPGEPAERGIASKSPAVESKPSTSPAAKDPPPPAPDTTASEAAKPAPSASPRADDNAPEPLPSMAKKLSPPGDSRSAVPSQGRARAIQIPNEARYYSQRQNGQDAAKAKDVADAGPPGQAAVRSKRGDALDRKLDEQQRAARPADATRPARTPAATMRALFVLQNAPQPSTGAAAGQAASPAATQPASPRPE